MKIKTILFIFFVFFLISCKNIDLDKCYEKVDEYCKNGKYLQAQNELENIPIKKRDYKFYLTHGMCYMWIDSNLYSVFAIKDFEKAYEFEPNKYWTNYYLGVTNFYLLNYEESLKYFIKAKDVFEKSFKEQYLNEASPYFYLIDVYYMLGNMNEAENCLKIAFEIDKYFESDLYIRLGLIKSFSNNDFNSLNLNYEKAKLITPNYPFLDKAYIHQLIRIGEYERAELKINEIIYEKKITDEWIYSEFAYLKLAQKKYIQAKRLLDKANSLYSKSKTTKRYFIYYYILTDDFNNQF